MLFSVAYLVVRRLFSCLIVLARSEVSNDAGLLVLRHENAVLRRQDQQGRRDSPVSKNSATITPAPAASITACCSCRARDVTRSCQASVDTRP